MLSYSLWSVVFNIPTQMHLSHVNVTSRRKRAAKTLWKDGSNFRIRKLPRQLPRRWIIQPLVYFAVYFTIGAPVENIPNKFWGLEWIDLNMTLNEVFFSLTKFSGGKKSGFYHDDIWNIKYLSGFKWSHLTEQIGMCFTKLFGDWLDKPTEYFILTFVSSLWKGNSWSKSSYRNDSG